MSGSMRYGGSESGVKYAYFSGETVDPEYRVVLTDAYGDIAYVKKKSELGKWLAGINFDTVTNVTVDPLP
jgi:hypothetical protein